MRYIFMKRKTIAGSMTPLTPLAVGRLRQAGVVRDRVAAAPVRMTDRLRATSAIRPLRGFEAKSLKNMMMKFGFRSAEFGYCSGKFGIPCAGL
jgi:hypothetical protein